MIKKLVLLSLVLSFGIVMRPAAGPELEARVRSARVRSCKVCIKSQEETEKILSCQGCKAANYCSTKCQKADWKEHKKTCARLNEAESRAYDALYNAVWDSKFATVKLAINKLKKEGVLRKIFLIMSQGKGTLFHIACFHGNEKIVKCFIEAGREVGVDIDIKEERGLTPLFIACQQGHLGVCKRLIAEGANIYLACDNGKTPFHQAVLNDSDDVVQYFIKEHGFDVNAVSSDGLTPLVLAAAGGSERVVERLIGARADVNKATTCPDKVTALLVACHGGYLNIVDRLVKANSDVNQVDAQGMTPLGAALIGRHQDVIVYLQEHGAILADFRAAGFPPISGAPDCITQ